MDPITGALIGGVVSGGLSFLGGESQNAANAQQASNMMDFQREMSNTSYQRAVADMKAAGLNPMLAYSHGGATTPGGAMAQMQNTLGNAVNSAQVGSKVAPEMAHVQEQAANLRADTENKASQGELYRAQAARLRTQSLVDSSLVPKYEQDVKTGVSSAAQLDAMAKRIRELLPYEKDTHTEGQSEARARGLLHASQTGLNEQYFNAGGRSREADRTSSEIARNTAEIHEILARAKFYGVESALKGFHIPAARNQAAVDESAYGRNVRPYLGDVGKGINSASDIFRMLPQGRTYYRGKNP